MIDESELSPTGRRMIQGVSLHTKNITPSADNLIDKPMKVPAYLAFLISSAAIKANMSDDEYIYYALIEKLAKDLDEKALTKSVKNAAGKGFDVPMDKTTTKLIKDDIKAASPAKHTAHTAPRNPAPEKK